MMVIFNVFIVFICLGKKNKPEFHEKVRENKDICCVVMPSKDTKILEFNQYRKSVKIPSIIYENLESLIKKVDE